MNTKSFFKILLLIISFILFKDSNAQIFKINGTIKGSNANGIAILNYFDNDLNGNKFDTTLVKNGKFSFSGKVIGANSLGIEVAIKDEKKYSYFLMIEPGNINVVLHKSGSGKIEVTGSTMHKEYELLQKELLYETTEFKKISDSTKIADSLLINALISDSAAQKMKKRINRNVPALYTSDLQKRIAYLKTHPDSYISLMELSYCIGRNPNDSIDVWYSSLSDKIKGGNMDKSFLKTYLKYRKAVSAEYPFDKLKLGEEAPTFYIYQNDNKAALGIKDFSGKVIVLELWGLSCVPCLYSNLALEKIRSKYSEEQIKIISLAKTFPGDIPRIVSYIKKNKFASWLHIVLNNDANEDLSFLLQGDFKNYIGMGIPRTVIIDQNGKVAYKSSGYSETEIKKADTLINSLINNNTTQ